MRARSASAAGASPIETIVRSPGGNGSSAGDGVDADLAEHEQLAAAVLEDVAEALAEVRRVDGDLDGSEPGEREPGQVEARLVLDEQRDPAALDDAQRGQPCRDGRRLPDLGVREVLILEVQERVIRTFAGPLRECIADREWQRRRCRPHADEPRMERSIQHLDLAPALPYRRSQDYRASAPFFESLACRSRDSSGSVLRRPGLSTVKFAMVAFNAGNGRDPADVYRENLEQARYAEELGFDAVWLTEHHFSDYALLGDPTLFASALAARRAASGIGTAVLVLPVHHPVRVAENTAFLDVLSSGASRRRHRPRLPAERVRGLPGPDGAIAGDLRRVDGSDRPALDPGGRRLPGRVLYAARARAVPASVQQPHPPLWVAAVSPGTFERAGVMGQPILTSPNFTPLPLIQANFAAYRDALTGSGFDRPRTTSFR